MRNDGDTTRPRATVTGWGSCLPPVKLTNADLETILDTDDRWIVERTGIRERGICHVETTDMAEVAARRALAAAGIDPVDIDLLVMATVTPEVTIPSNACVLQDRLGAVNAASFDLNAACSGFVYGTTMAHSMIATGAARRALVVGAEKLHWVMDYADRSTCILFGDGAGAAVYQASTRGDGVLATDLGSDGSSGSIMVTEIFGSKGGVSANRDPARSQLHFEGQAVFKMAVRFMTDSVNRTLERASLTIDDVAVLIPHQANARIIEATGRRLGIDPDRVIVNIHETGNTAAASIPIALSRAVDAGLIAPGDVVVLTAFGGGVTWGSVVLRWSDRVTPLATCDAELPPTRATAFDLIAPNLDFYAPLHH
ncbi:MAG: beta-ketoacyl-ACP synthase III [Acidimicrobiales bacterium]